MKNTSREQVLADIEISGYAEQFKSFCGADAFYPENVDASFEYMAEAIVAFEGSIEVNPFISRFDAVLAGTDVFTAEEAQGYKLFKGRESVLIATQ